MLALFRVGALFRVDPVSASLLGRSDAMPDRVCRQGDAATKMDELLTRGAAENPVATSVATKPAPSTVN